MANPIPPDLQAAFQKALADPNVKAAAQAYASAPKGGHNGLSTNAGGAQSYTQFLSAIQPYLPSGYHAQIDPSSGEPSLVKNGLPSMVWPIAAFAIGLTAGAATGAFSVPAAEAAATGTATTAATTAPVVAGTVAPLTTAKVIAGVQTGKSILDTAKDIGNTLGAAEKGRADARVTESLANQAQDRNALSLYDSQLSASNAQNNFNLNRGTLDLNSANSRNNFAISRNSAANENARTDLSQREFALTAPNTRAGTAVRGDILSNARDVSIAAPSGINVPQISGGLRPSMFSDATRQLGTTITNQALAAQQKGDTFAPLPALPDYSAPTSALPDYAAPPAAPSLTPLPQAGALDSILTTAGTVGALAPSFQEILDRYRKKPQPVAPAPVNFGNMADPSGYY